MGSVIDAGLASAILLPGPFQPLQGIVRDELYGRLCSPIQGRKDSSQVVPLGGAGPAGVGIEPLVGVTHGQFGYRDVWPLVLKALQDPAVIVVGCLFPIPEGV